MNRRSIRNMRDLKPRCKLWLSSGDAEGVFGDGKWRLLRTIEETGSLKSAAERLGISYRKAWGDLKKAETSLNITLIEKHRGGLSGGQTHLTATGRQWLRGYSLFRRDIERAIKKAYKAHIVELAQ